MTMEQVRAVELSCDRCGSRDLQKGSRDDMYKLGWSVLRPLFRGDHVAIDGTTLCPRCATTYGAIVTRFMKSAD